MRTLALLILVSGCAPEGGTLSMSFARKTLYDAPFPSDDLLSATGVPDVSLVPNPNNVDLIVQGMKMLTADARGFSRAGHIYFRADQELDPSTFPDAPGSLRDDASIFLMALDDQKRTPVECGYFADGGPHGDESLLSILPVQGLPMRAKTRYAAVVTNRVKDKLGRPLRPSPTMQSILDGQRPAGLRADVADAYIAAAKAVKAKNPVAMAVFTTDDPSDQLARVRADMLTRPLPIPSPAPTLTRTDVFDEYCVYETTVDIPSYQEGEEPFARAGGGWKFTAEGAPIFQHIEKAKMFITIPRKTMPAGGWPTVVFVRVGGGGDRPLVDRGRSPNAHFDQAVVPGTGPAMEFAKVGFAGVQFDGPNGGLRNPMMDDETFLFFNFFNAPALRDNLRETAAELALMPHVLKPWTFSAADCAGASASVKFDSEKIAIMGHSNGAWVAPMAAAYEPMYKALILSGAGGSYVANLMDKQLPLKVKPFAEVLLDYNKDARELTAHDPALMLVQWGVESSDPQVYGERVRGRHVLMLQGIVDHYILPSIANATSLPMGLDLAGESLDESNAEEQMLKMVPLKKRLELVGKMPISLPASGNANGATAVVVQHNGDGIQDGHETAFQTEPPKAQYRCFLDGFAKGTPTVPAAGGSCP